MACGIAFLLFLLVPLVAVALTLWREIQLRRGHLIRAIRSCAPVAWRSKKKYIIAAIGVLIGATFGAEPLSLMLGEVLTGVVAAVTTLAWVFRPPAVVVLASSPGHQARCTIAELGLSAAAGYRVAFFLRIEGLRMPFTFELAVSDVLGNVYLGNDAQWAEVVFRCLDVVPVIVVDTWNISPGLGYELERIDVSPALAAKTFVIVDDWSTHLLADFARLSTRTIREHEVDQAVAGALLAARRTPPA